MRKEKLTKPLSFSPEKLGGFLSYCALRNRASVEAQGSRVEGQGWRVEGMRVQRVGGSAKVEGVGGEGST